MDIIIDWTCVVLKAKPYSAESKMNSSWSNLQKGWGSPTSVYSTSRREYEVLGLWTTRIRASFEDWTDWNNFKMGPSTGRHQMQLFCQLSRNSCLGKMMPMLNRFGNGGSRCHWSDVHVRIGRWDRMQNEASSDKGYIQESVWIYMPQDISQGCHM